MKQSGPEETNESEATVLKTGTKRTVSLVRMPGGAEAQVVKRFHAPGAPLLGPLGPWFQAAFGDRRRALGEARALRAAKRAGLPVPSVLNCSRRDGCWELTTEAIPSARPLAAVLDEAFLPSARALPPVAIHRLAEQISTLARASLAAGFIHADPHPANALVDASGQLWIIDLARSRTGASEARVEASLIRGLSRLRELCPRSFRLRIARAFFQGELDRAWVRRAEERAIRSRVDELERRVAVWRRTSTATEVRADALGSPAVHVRSRSGHPAAGWRVERATSETLDVDAAWSALVRAKLHRIPCAEPRALGLGSSGGASAAGPRWIEFEVPDNGSSVPCPQELGRLQARLCTRGLGPVDAAEEGSVLVSPSGEALIGPRAKLIPKKQGGRPHDLPA